MSALHHDAAEVLAIQIGLTGTLTPDRIDPDDMPRFHKVQFIANWATASPSRKVSIMLFSLRSVIAFLAFLALFQCSIIEQLLAQNFVEYPNQNQTYGTHTLNSNWVGGPTGLTVTFDADDTTLHEDGIGSSQRTARNTQNFVGPSSATNPQNYDDLDLVNAYGSRLPLIQQMSADGISTLTYAFDDPVNIPLDLFVTDLDNSDFATIKAFDDQNVAMDMNEWLLVAEGDLSLFKDTGSNFSTTIAPTPNTVFETNQISLTAVNDTNYNRSFSIFRNPSDLNLSKIEITFTGTKNSPNRDSPNTGAHIYMALTTAVPAPGDFNFDGEVDIDDIEQLKLNFGQPASVFPAMDLNDDGTITLADHDLHITTQVRDANGTGALLGDLNLDGDVDVSQFDPITFTNLGDASRLLANLGQASGMNYADGDLNGDGDVDISQFDPITFTNLGDASRLLANLGQSTAPAAAASVSAVPEPGSLMWLALAGIIKTFRHKMN